MIRLVSVTQALGQFTNKDTFNVSHNWGNYSTYMHNTIYRFLECFVFSLLHCHFGCCNNVTLLLYIQAFYSKMIAFLFAPDETPCYLFTVYYIFWVNIAGR